MRLEGLLGLAVLLSGPELAAEELVIRRDDSIFAVVTHRGGFAAKKAHNHLIAAAGYQASLAFDPQAPLLARFELALAAGDLAVDRWDLEQAWYPRLAELGILADPFTEIGEEDRQKIRRSMLASDQLDGGRFPHISATVAGVEESPSTHGGVIFPYAVRLVLEVRGKSVEKPVAARFEAAGSSITVEALGSFRFSDFGIKPYSAFFGAVKNEDEIHVYLNLKADRP